MVCPASLPPRVRPRGRRRPQPRGPPVDGPGGGRSPATDRSGTSTSRQRPPWPTPWRNRRTEPSSSPSALRSRPAHDGGGVMATLEARAIEAIVMVADEPVEPNLLAQLLEIPTARVEGSAQELAAGYEAEDRGFVTGPGGRRLPLPEPRRPGALRRALRARGPERPAVGRRPRDPRHRRLQAAGQPRAQIAAIRGVNVDGVLRTLVHAATSAEVGRDPGPGPGRRSTAPPARSSSRSASTPSTTCRPRRLRARGRVSRRSSRACVDAETAGSTMRRRPAMMPPRA